jgi:hypothetical protein
MYTIIVIVWVISCIYFLYFVFFECKWKKIHCREDPQLPHQITPGSAEYKTKNVHIFLILSQIEYFEFQKFHSMIPLRIDGILVKFEHCNKPTQTNMDHCFIYFIFIHWNPIMVSFLTLICYNVDPYALLIYHIAFLFWRLCKVFSCIN